MILKSICTKAVLVLLCSIPLWPGVVHASPESAVPVAQNPTLPPQIDSFSVKPVESLSPGTELTFTLLGTPNATATLTISGVTTNLPMKQIEPGVYQGRYTIRTEDAMTEATVIRANLVKGDLISSVRLDQSLLASETTPQIVASEANSTVFIRRFRVQPTTAVQPGTELVFTLLGTPKATASYSIEGILTERPMQEVSPGVYTGRYVLRTQDPLPESGAKIYATLQSGDQSVRVQLGKPLIAAQPATDKLFLDILSPEEQSKVEENFTVKGRSLPDAVVQVNVQAVTSFAGVIGFNRTIFEEEVAVNQDGNFSFTVQPGFAAVPGTRYEIQLSAMHGDQTQEKSLVVIQQ